MIILYHNYLENGSGEINKISKNLLLTLHTNSKKGLEINFVLW